MAMEASHLKGQSHVTNLPLDGLIQDETDPQNGVKNMALRLNDFPVSSKKVTHIGAQFTKC